MDGSRDTKGTAAELAKQVGIAKPAGVVAAFYDPYVPRPSLFERQGDYGKAHIDERQELRAQVRDFVKWLKSQGVI
jgi:hypothetical protein